MFVRNSEHSCEFPRSVDPTSDAIRDLGLPLWHTVESAVDGRDALDKFNEGVFDVVISDRAMPEMNGDQLSAAIKKNAPEMPFIMLTGFGEMMETSEERPAGVDLVIGKPVTLRALRDALATVTSGR